MTMIMRRFLFLFAVPAFAADLPPDKGNTIPESGKRPVVVNGRASLALPKHDLPEGYTLSVAAASPLVTHPIMGCLDDKGRLFVGDATGFNWNKKQLEENPPNRVLMLEDTDKDGIFDKSTIFADKMTFPQGACWLNGSLYVGSPPGIWKLTDTNNDGVADQREMIVGGFDYTGNAADIHGPFLHPNGRLYWCHGRKGHDVKQKDGTPVDASLACGIWSCQPDGSDVAWHSLGCGDNPVEVDFTRSGDIIGVQNLYYTQPRGDTIIHWLYGGVYERSDQLKAIAHLPRTLETMPVMYNFGHVAVSGSCFWRSYGNADTPVRNKGAENFMVTHFNTQRLVRMELTPEGSTYKAVENEFLKLHNPDIHLTDVMEDADGSLLLIDTGGWFRIGCPSSLMAKSDLLGAVYRIKPTKPRTAPLASRSADAPVRIPTQESAITDLKSKSPHVRRHALEWIASTAATGVTHADWFKVLADKLDPTLEHTAVHACAKAVGPAEAGEFLGAALKQHDQLGDEFMARVLRAVSGRTRLAPEFSEILVYLADARDPKLALTAISFASSDVGTATVVLKKLEKTFLSRYKGGVSERDLAEEQIMDSYVYADYGRRLEVLISRIMETPEAQGALERMLRHQRRSSQQCALHILATHNTNGVLNTDWLPLLKLQLADSPTPLVLDAIKKLKTPHFDTKLQAIANDTKRPLAIRLKALDSAKTVKLTGETFDMVKNVLANAASSSAAKIQAAGMLATAPMTKEQMPQIAPLLATVGPVELKTLLPLLKRHREVEVVKLLCREIAKNPAIASQQESLYRTALADLPPEIFETIILPAYNTAAAASEPKKRQLGPLADKVIASGNAANGRKHFDTGKGTCIACHKIGDVGRAIGPDLSHIGAIRTERDLLESILFPSNTLARDYEAHVIETSDGQQTMGVIKSHTAEGLLVVDIAGQEKNVAHQTITGDTTLTTSLMPLGLDQTLPEPELLDLVAWLRSLK